MDNGQVILAVITIILFAIGLWPVALAALIALIIISHTPTKSSTKNREDRDQYIADLVETTDKKRKEKSEIEQLKERIEELEKKSNMESLVDGNKKAD